MAIMKNVVSTSWIAGGTIGQYEPVKLNTAEGSVIVCAADDDLCIGVSMIDAVADDTVSIAGIGSFIPMRVGATAAPLKGGLVGLDTSDPTEVMVYSSTPNDMVLGVCVETNTVNKNALVMLTLSPKTA